MLSYGYFKFYKAKYKPGTSTVEKLLTPVRKFINKKSNQFTFSTQNFKSKTIIHTEKLSSYLKRQEYDKDVRKRNNKSVSKNNASESNIRSPKIKSINTRNISNTKCNSISDMRSSSALEKYHTIVSVNNSRRDTKTDVKNKQRFINTYSANKTNNENKFINRPKDKIDENKSGNQAISLDSKTKSINECKQIDLNNSEVSKPPIVPDKNRNSSNLYESSDEIEIDQIRLSNPKFPFKKHTNSVEVSQINGDCKPSVNKWMLKHINQRHQERVSIENKIKEKSLTDKKKKILTPSDIDMQLNKLSK